MVANAWRALRLRNRPRQALTVMLVSQVFTDESLAYSVTVPSDVAESVSADISRFIQTRFHQEAAWVEATPTFVAAL